MTEPTPNPNPPIGKLRFQRPGGVCRDCGECDDRMSCQPIRQPLRAYNGIRFTADGFDCALPVSMDSHSVCSFKCLYCFSNFLGGHGHNVGQMSTTKLERILTGDSSNALDQAMYKALKRDQRQPCPLQFGALTDPFDNIERNQGWALRLPALLRKYNQPIRVSTKGRLLADPEYLAAWAQPDLVWVAFSTITCDDELLAQIDRFAPSPTQRLATMKALSDRGVATSLRFRPCVPGISDSTRRHPKAYKELIERAAAAGARAISMEVLFAPGKLDGTTAISWDRLERFARLPLRRIYREVTPGLGACIRPSRAWTEDFLHACREVAKGCGLTFAVSDPVWKELNDTGCCCGILPDDPVFGNWQREQATNIVFEAKADHDAGRPARLWGPDALVPPWAKDVPMRALCMATGKAGLIKNTLTWADKLTVTWNDLHGNRGPLHYFQGILEPASYDTKHNILYRYVPKPRQHKPSVWKV